MLNADLISVYARLASAYVPKEVCSHGKAKTRRCIKCEEFSTKNA